MPPGGEYSDAGWIEEGMSRCAYTSLKWPMEHAVGLPRLGGEGNEMQAGDGAARYVGGVGTKKGALEEEDIRVAVSEPGVAPRGHVSCHEREGI